MKIGLHIYGVQKWTEQIKEIDGYRGTLDDPMNEYKVLVAFAGEVNAPDVGKYDLKYIGFAPKVSK